MNQFLSKFWRMGFILSVAVNVYAPIKSQTLAMSQQQVREKVVASHKMRQLNEVLIDLKKQYKVDLLFEGGLVEGINTPADLVNYNLSLERNLQNVLVPGNLTFKKTKSGAYLIVAGKKGSKLPESTGITEPAQSAETPQTLPPAERHTVASVSPGLQAPAEISISGKDREREKRRTSRCECRSKRNAARDDHRC